MSLNTKLMVPVGSSLTVRSYAQTPGRVKSNASEIPSGLGLS